MALNSEASVASKRKWAQAPEFDQPATVAQKFENLYGAGFYRTLNFAILRRTCIYELENAKDLDDTERRTLERCRDEAEALLEENLRYLEENLNYQAVPIQKLVRIQMASGLLYAKYAHDKAAQEHGV